MLWEVEDLLILGRSQGRAVRAIVSCMDQRSCLERICVIDRLVMRLTSSIGSKPIISGASSNPQGKGQSKQESVSSLSILCH